MKFFFYNSFTLGSGYKYAELKNGVISSTNLPIDIDCDFCNGGCKMVVKKTKSNTSILVLKDILYVNNQKKFDEQGRKVYINFAIEATSDEQDILNNIFFAMIAEWDNLCRYLGEAVKIPYSVGTYGYGIEQNSIESLIDYLTKYDTVSVKDKIGVNKNNLNVIVLKSSDYTYYESLSRDLYRSHKEFFISDFVSTNIISKDDFTDLISKKSNHSYEEFAQLINGSIVEKEDSSNESESEIIHKNKLDLVNHKNLGRKELAESPVNGGEERKYRILSSSAKYIIVFFLGLLLGFLLGK